MDQDEILDQLFELALFQHTFAMGALMRRGSLSPEMAFSEMQEMRAKLMALYEAAGRAVPFLVRENER